ncbi:hypothetical protein CEXT_486211 [Caerostris extrusa]|uniref:Uncharacterized protein n=1 Tax=Caerostris extrusa TaxID=172846 RepID=A0AAV4N292_CAEEX|nr:hypothetical protein CEXT_486211 [Caerostris extrusa]
MVMLKVAAFINWTSYHVKISISSGHGTQLNSLSHRNPSKTSMRSVQCIPCRMFPHIQEVSAPSVFVNVAGFLEVTSPEGNFLPVARASTGCASEEFIEEYWNAFRKPLLFH